MAEHNTPFRTRPHSVTMLTTVIVGENGDAIADAFEPEYAEFIVLACNAHDDLVAALEKARIDVDMAITLFSQSGTDPEAWAEMARDTIDAALAKAGES